MASLWTCCTGIRLILSPLYGPLRDLALLLVSRQRGQVSVSFTASLQRVKAGPGLLSNLLASHLIVHAQHLWGCVHTPLCRSGDSQEAWEILCENGQIGWGTHFKLIVNWKLFPYTTESTAINSCQHYSEMHFKESFHLFVSATLEAGSPQPWFC